MNETFKIAALRFAAAALLVVELGACASVPPPEPDRLLSDRPEPHPQKIVPPSTPGYVPVTG